MFITVNHPIKSLMNYANCLLVPETGIYRWLRAVLIQAHVTTRHSPVVWQCQQGGPVTGLQLGFGPWLWIGSTREQGFQRSRPFTILAPYCSDWSRLFGQLASLVRPNFGLLEGLLGKRAERQQFYLQDKTQAIQMAEMSFRPLAVFVSCYADCSLAPHVEGDRAFRARI